jgi:predicted molibdopterin-dependent oxidoreductase YjgC
MKIASRFLARPDEAEMVHMTLDGEAITARANDSVAAALLAHTGSATRETAQGAPRSAYCMMGVCFDCLVEVDGRPNTQGCMTPVREGMVLRRQRGLRVFAGSDADA